MTNKDTPGNHLTVWGFAISLIFTVLVGLWAGSRFDEIIALKPDEIGTLVAGVCSPLAFFWLVLGFFQQGQELRASVRALQLQGEELHASVEQQKQLVEVTRQEMDYRAQRDEAEDLRVFQAQPKLVFSSTKSDNQQDARCNIFDVTVKNVGAKCRNFEIVIGPTDGVAFQAGNLDQSSPMTFEAYVLKGSAQRHSLIATYVDLHDQPRSQTFWISPQDGSITDGY